ncbi:hypothetical protein GCM10023339_08540 [Alloalcanivorax gelatiniphagus]
MRISVECGGFTRAADSCLAANQTCAVLTGTLTSRLSGCAGMAGDDATSISFAQAYDESAREAVRAVADLTHAFIGAGRLLVLTGDHHALAEAAAAGLPARGTTPGGGDDDAFVWVRPPSPPSSLGGQEPSFGTVDAWILDQVEGFAWPSADLDLLREAGAAWRRAAQSVAGLADNVDVAVTLVEQQRSPEVPIAVEALTGLTTVIGDTAWQLSNLATACEEYADAVEAAHARTRALLSEIAQMIVEGAVISVLVTGLTGGLGGGAAAAAAAARVRAHAPRFVALLTALRAGVAVAVARIEKVCDELADTRARVEKFLHIPARDEVGSMKHPLGWFSSKEPGWLRRHEMPGHTIERHVGKSEQDMLERLQRRPDLRRTSTFEDEAAAEKFIASVLKRRSADVESWLEGPGKRLTLIEEMGERTGTTIARDGSAHSPTAIRVVLEADGNAPSGWRILTAFPD